ncbi:MAG: hypothetical protein ABI904_02500 [Chloroflexota bacterium]
MKIKNTFKVWLPFAVVITAFSMLAYATVQQVYRQGANDPQIQMAVDAAYMLEQGKPIDEVIPNDVIDMERSLAPFYVVYNLTEQPVAGTGYLNDSLQTLPPGVLEYTSEEGQDRITWQPQPNVRIAAVIVPYKDGYVLAGRNLSEVEDRESQTSLFVDVTWILALVATFIVIAVGEYVLSKN